MIHKVEFLGRAFATFFVDVRTFCFTKIFGKLSARRAVEHGAVMFLTAHASKITH